VLSLIVNIIVLIYTYYLIKKYNMRILFIEVVLILILKLIPVIILYLYHYEKLIYINELLIFTPLFFLFIIWKHVINNININGEYDIFVKNGIPENGPLANIINKLFE